jgi:Nif-specific regulatory protein
MAESRLETRARVGTPAAMSSRLSLLVDLASRLGREVEFDALLGVAGERLAAALSCERATIWLIDAESHELVTRVAVLPELPALRQPMGKGIAGYVARTGETVRIEEAAKDPRFDPSADRVTGFTTRSMLVVPLREDERAPVRGVVQLLNRYDGAFDLADEEYLVALASQLARALSLTTLRSEDARVPGVTLRGPFNRIIGRSSELRRVYEQISLAAETDASVLLRGETGTGKGIFARAIHVNSARQGGPFVTVDCTTLPGQLVESELFGHERGAFTGADRRVPGRVELATHGTLFLDEIGDLPLDVQGKLLRFLQDRTFERVGGRTTLQADVRVVAATHRDLEAGVAEGTFREDLYYRIRVVEMVLPPLRLRGAAEIDSLATHFAAMYAKRYSRPVPCLEPATLAALHAHTWPGNVRELEHWVESAVVLSRDGTIRPEHLPRRATGAAAPEVEPAKGVSLGPSLTLEEASRRYAVAQLELAGGNRTETARRLGISRNRLARLLGGTAEGD